ncbi:hypothetical protein PSN45_001652 [Yamadazyma tenuis]|uniref:RGS domain-containing protein n=1 Tax=Candida tenuis (strain ATCC 10573 / BCRC 21748 / CBS 615 / JCM 9827 / NBRC 10315 / NRRL Y-1498 / VKM Y-70) TaxID=590646 RepID=G3BES4_CANTC|nr:uncharacterized protein CANTEDRAFT_116661 [Yamadazyma tenuis ATCC 10573]EGV60579.1 hypothetical protein CANTEDRAFT_116661 [Yamadazyma tenuis ATCC 10573]WEJ94172.1 hypothetical protein PSN45_001652 [Yamadazyma tenuis]
MSISDKHPHDPTLDNIEYDYLPSLDQFLNDAFLFSINQVKSQPKIDFINRFNHFTSSLHCLENLQFLVSIYHYEFSYNRIFNTAPQLNPNRNSVVTVESIDTLDNLPINYFASTIDDIDASGENCWTEFMERQLEDDNDDEDDQDMDSYSSATTTLCSQWQYLVDNFICPTSKYQVNLSNSTCKQLLSIKEKYPSPLVLVAAKKEVMQLLEENAFHRFIKEYKSYNQVPCEDCNCGMQSQPEAHTEECPREVQPLYPESQAVKKPFLKKSPTLNPFKFSRPSSPLSINSASITPTNSTPQSHNSVLNRKKTKSYSLLASGNTSPSHSGTSLSNLLSHLKFNKSSNSSSNTSIANSLNTSHNTSPIDDGKKFKFSDKNSV